MKITQKIVLLGSAWVAAFGMMVAVTGCGTNSVKSPPITGEVTQEEVVTHKKYYNREKDECTMPDGGVLLNYSKWMNADGSGLRDVADDCGEYRDIRKSVVDYAKEYPQGLVAPGRYDMLVRRKLMDKEEANQVDRSDEALQENIDACKSGVFGNLSGDAAVAHCDRHYPIWRR